MANNRLLNKQLLLSVKYCQGKLFCISQDSSVQLSQKLNDAKTHVGWRRGVVESASTHFFNGCPGITPAPGIPSPFPSLEHALLIFTRLVFTTSLLSESLTQAMYSCTSLQVQSKI